MPKKSSDKNPEFSKDRESRVLLEEIRSEVRAIHEGFSGMEEKVSCLPQIQEDIKELKSDMAIIKAIGKEHSKEIAGIKGNISEIKTTFATKRDVQDLAQTFDKRLVALEHR